MGCWNILQVVGKKMAEPTWEKMALQQQRRDQSLMLRSSPSVENETHCDFVKLREMLLRVNMEDLREQTHARHYELYRRCKLEEMGFKDTDPDTEPFRYRASRDT